AAGADGVSEANGRGFRDFRDLLIYGVRNTPLPEFPPTDLPTPPERLSVAIVDRLVRLVDTIEDADGFNDDTASALGIQSPVSERLPESEWKPVLIVDEEMAFRLLVEFKKGDSDGLTLYQQVGDSADWEKVGTYPKSPIELTITPPVANQPVAVKLKGCFIKNNKPVGEMSSVSETVARP
ncbi:MAG TPA: hypothetical protein PKY59_18580, partial [Pyrinomonadaceae bacterium]|nr:hypothetical protein [Pyrinomonadaceae bacterium]